MALLSLLVLTLLYRHARAVQIHLVRSIHAKPLAHPAPPALEPCKSKVASIAMIPLYTFLDIKLMKIWQFLQFSCLFLRDDLFVQGFNCRPLRKHYRSTSKMLKLASASVSVTVNNSNIFLTCIGSDILILNPTKTWIFLQ